MWEETKFDILKYSLPLTNLPQNYENPCLAGPSVSGKPQSASLFWNKAGTMWMKREKNQENKKKKKPTTTTTTRINTLTDRLKKCSYSKMNKKANRAVKRNKNILVQSLQWMTLKNSVDKLKLGWSEKGLCDQWVEMSRRSSEQWINPESKIQGTSEIECLHLEVWGVNQILTEPNHWSGELYWHLYSKLPEEYKGKLVTFCGTCYHSAMNIPLGSGII